MQTSDAVTYADGGSLAEATQNHPVGEVTLGARAALGVRSRLLRSSGCDAGDAVDLPFTTCTITLS